MPALPWSPLSDAPPFPAEGYAPLADAVGRILNTRNDVLLLQGEAVVALEAVAVSLGAPGRRALNIVTSLYGRWFGGWLRRAGVTVTDLVAEPGRPVTAAEVARAIEGGRFDIVALVHAESAYGILNPLAEIAALARDHGAITIVDAVASVGGHTIDADALGLDVVVIGPQKALAGQAGVSAVAMSEAAWDRVAPAGEAPSILSLADLRDGWIRTGRKALPGTPSALEFHALAQTLARVEAEGLDRILARHAAAAGAARAGVAVLTGALHVPAAQASNLVTAVPLPPGLTAAGVLSAAPGGHALGPGVGPGGDRLVRINHTGLRAEIGVVLAEVAALADALIASGQQVDRAGALAAVVAP